MGRKQSQDWFYAFFARDPGTGQQGHKFAMTHTGAVGGVEDEDDDLLHSELDLVQHGHSLQ